MPSPFPGMDPFIEGQCWRDFHASLIAVARDALIRQLRPRYVVHIEESVYFTDDTDESIGLAIPDLRIAEKEERWQGSSGATATAIKAEPTLHTVPAPEQVEQTYIEIRSTRLRKLVTIIEILSPTNKEPGKGREQYLFKRANVLSSRVNLVELDLLRRGQRLPAKPSLKAEGHYAFISRVGGPADLEAFHWGLRQPMLTIPVPLEGSDDDAILPLQELFTTVYDRAGYDYSLDYEAALDPPLRDANENWVRERLSAARARTT